MCTPNPCEHSGICNVTGPSSYSCDCNGTGYTGSKCEIGIIEMPQYPTLTVLTQTQFTLFAYPDYELSVRLTSRKGLGFHPSSILTFDPTKTSANVSITASVVGIFVITYEIRGKSSLQFQQPQPSTLIITPNISILPQYFTSRRLEQGLLEAGSCAYATPLDYTCPNEGNKLSFSSTCQWYGSTSPGLIFSEYNDLSLPVAIAGARISNINTSGRSMVLPLMESDLQKSCNFVHAPRRSCDFKPPDLVQEIQNFLRTEALGHTFLSQVEQLIPRWLQFSVNSNTPRTYDFTSYMIILTESDSLSDTEKCPNIIKVNDGMYSILKYSGSLNFSVNSSSHSFTPQRSPVCFAVNLCEGLNSPLLITIPDEAQAIVNSLSFMQVIKSYNWDITINSIAISSTSFSHELTGSNRDYWFGNREMTYSFPDSTIIANGIFTHSFSLGTLQIIYSLDGRAYMLYDNFDKVGSLR